MTPFGIMLILYLLSWVPIYEMIRMTDNNKPCIHLVYEWWDSMIENVRKAIYMIEFTHVITPHCQVSKFYDVVYSIIIS